MLRDRDAESEKQVGVVVSAHVPAVPQLRSDSCCETRRCPVQGRPVAAWNAGPGDNRTLARVRGISCARKPSSAQGEFHRRTQLARISDSRALPEAPA
eukprot:1852572-Pleurochrysis_carterae.AAC.5